jgi:hypothetical protein
MRLMQQAATGGGQGVVGHLDCIVRATSPATAGITIDPGGVAINGVEAVAQGSYTAWNIGLDSTLSIGATGGSARSDMIVARAEDPTFSGSPWGGSPAGQIVFPRVISNVGSGATTVPGGFSAIPLARIDMPASTATVQSSYIHDLRQVAVPQRSLGVVAAAGPSSSTNWNTSGSPHLWPPGATWSVQIPSWATNVVALFTVNDAFYGDTVNARGFLNLIFGASVSSPNLSFPQTLVSVPSGSNSRNTLTGGSQVTIPASLRGTTQTMQISQQSDGTQTGKLTATEDTQVSVIYQFQQVAVAA